jgi:4-amino-4-deoxy-L-arabinose transferase-like glycosyltransferase
VRQTILRVACFAALAGLYLNGLGRVGLLGPDEPRYASIGRDMARSGDWITPHLWGEPWFEKPALLYWLVGVAYKLGFTDEIAPRIGVAIASMAFLVFFWTEMRRHFGERSAAWATAVLSTSAGWFAFSQVGVTDLPMSAAFAASILLALRWLDSPSLGSLAAAGGLLGVAVLAKGFVPVVLALPLVWVGRRRARDLLIYAAAAAVVAAPWYFLCYARNGWPFIREFFIEHHLERATSDALQHVQPWWFYIPVLLAGLFPWSPMIGYVYRPGDARDARRLLLLLIAAWGLLFFSVSANKLPGYVLPLFPAIAALIGIHLAEARRIAPALVTSALLLALTPTLASILPTAIDEGLSRARLGATTWLGALTLPVAGLCWYLEGTNRRELAIGTVAAAAFAAIAYLQFATYPVLDRDVSARQQWRTAPPACVAPYARRTVVYGLNFYAGRSLPECPEIEVVH